MAASWYGPSELLVDGPAVINGEIHAGIGDALVHVTGPASDRLTGTTARVSVGARGEQLVMNSFAADMTPDGTRVALFSGAAQGSDDARVYVKDLATGALIDASEGLEGLGHHTLPRGASLTDDGRYVAFAAIIQPSAEGAPPLMRQAIVRDLESGALEVVSASPSGAWANKDAINVALSGNGRYVVFTSLASNLVPGMPAPANPEVFRKDRFTGAIDMASVAPGGIPDQQADPDATLWVSITPDGRTMLFASVDDTLAPFDLHPGLDVVVRRYGSILTGDVNEDGAVNAIDLALVIGAWGTTDAASDLDGDGDVDSTDLAIVLGGWTS